MSNDNELDGQNLWPEDPRYQGMFTVEGNMQVCELITAVINMARANASRDEVEQALRRGVQLIEDAGYPEVGDSDVRDRITDALCRSWGIETPYRLRFESYDERRGQRAAK